VSNESDGFMSENTKKCHTLSSMVSKFSSVKLVYGKFVYSQVRSLRYALTKEFPCFVLR